MKRLLNLLHNLLKRGCLRIFPKPQLCELLSLSLLAVYGCSTSRHVPGLVEHTSTDTLCLSQVQYDSIYIFQDRLLDRSRDTVYLRDVSIEYRYRLHRDTIYKVHHDTIPYQVTVTEVKEITRPLTFFDHLTRFTFWFAVGALLTFLFINKSLRLCIKPTQDQERNSISQHQESASTKRFRKFALAS